MSDAITTPTALAQHWLMEARQLEEAAKHEDISEEEAMLSKYLAEQLRRCVKELDAVYWPNPTVSRSITDR